MFGINPRAGFSNLSRLPEIYRCYRETDTWRAVMLDYLGVRPLRFPYQLHLRSGENIVLVEHLDVVIFWLVFVRRHYPVNPSDHAIFDVGANTGIFTIYAARQAPLAKIIAIEPFPETCMRLTKHVEANHISDRVTVLNCAVDEESGVKAMDSTEGIPSQYRRVASEATASLNARHRGTAALKNVAGVSVHAKTLADVLEMTHADDVDLMKMNIHGSEYAVLMNAPSSVLQHFKRIAVQHHEMPADAQMGKVQLFSHLGESGFHLIYDRDTGRGSGLALLSIAS
jgi:FkbM family methyltransferase